ncbi:hypothetical protein V2I01_20195 [Micromonospora sp. BRA006-A]|nr:hypothetical protein [Micromonospora sp. BRA006-A]
MGVGQSLTRALVGVAVEWPGLVLPLLSWVASVTVMLTDPRGRRLGDLVAGTLVVHSRGATLWRPLPPAPPPLLAWAATLDLTRFDGGLALAVRQYLDRLPQLAEPDRFRLGRAPGRRSPRSPRRLRRGPRRTGLTCPPSWPSGGAGGAAAGPGPGGHRHALAGAGPGGGRRTGRPASGCAG